MRGEDYSIIFGLLIALGSIMAAVYFRFPYWYTFSLLGGIGFFGGLNSKHGLKSVYSAFLQKRWKRVLVSYLLAGLIGGLIVDVFYGRTIGDLWAYPFLKGSFSYLVPILFYYPLGGIQIYEMFYYFKYILSTRLHQKKLLKENGSHRLFMAWLLGASILSYSIPLANYFFFSNRYANEIIIVTLLPSILLFDSVLYQLKRRSLFLELVQGDIAVTLALFLTWVAGVVLHEVPNTFAQEWVYHNIPFASFEIFGINVLIATIGWLWLIFWGVPIIEIGNLSTG